MAADGNGRSKGSARRQGLGRGLAMVVLGGMALGNAECAMEREPIDQTRPARLDKHFFLGANLRDARDNPEFYMNNYVVDAPASQSLVSVGTYDDVDRIRWEIQEGVLLARKAYEYVTGSDGRGVRGRTETGLVVAAYRIESHFDVRRAYNPTTGEEINVVQENTTDRPWYEREFMRVDWSQNMVDNPDWSGLFYGSLFGDLSFQPVRYYEQDPAHPNAPNFCEMTPGMARNATTGACERVAGRGNTGGYLDVTSRWLVNPEMSNSFGFPLPTCLLVNFFTGSDTYDCNPQETTIRTSFRVVEDRDFQPLELTRAPYDLVGGPRATRNGFDPGYGVTDQNFHRYAMIHNIWQRSHLRNAQNQPLSCEGRDLNRDGTPDGTVDANSNGTADACEAAATAARLPADQWTGSQCDPVMHQCTIPYRNRAIRPIAYYANPEMGPEFQDHVDTVNNTTGEVVSRLPLEADYRANRVIEGASEQIINTWDIAVRRAVANAREVECRRIGTGAFGGNREACHGRFFENGQVPQGDGAFLGDNPRVAAQGVAAANHVNRAVVLCHNPVRFNDNAACREVGYSVRLGDIRYNHITYWPGNSRAPFGGIAHWGYDPLTGEVVSNGAMNMGRSVEFAAAQQRDYVRLILNSIDPSLDPLTVDEYTGGAPSTQLLRYIRNPASTNLGSIDQGATEQTVAERAASPDHHRALENTQARVPSMGGNLEAGPMFMANVDQTMERQEVSQTELQYRALARRLQNTPVEASLIDRTWLRAAGVDPNRALDTNTLERVSPLRHLDPESATAFRDSIMRRAEARGYCFQDAGAPAMIGSQDMQGVARWFARRYRDMTPEARARRILHDLRIDAYKGIALHEVGHSIGLYHVPVSSYDSMNYNPQYWQLRTHNGTAGRSCRPDNCAPGAGACNSTRNADRNRDNCMGPRWIDPESDEEIGVRPLDAPHHSAGAGYFGNTSTMEYQWERFGETVGLGQYDIYAMGILYGRVVETMDRNVPAFRETNDQHRFAPRLRTQLSNQDYAYYADPQIYTPQQRMQAQAQGEPFSGIHYTELARQLQVFDPARCRAATPAELERYRWRLVDGQICGVVPRDHAALTDMETSQYYNRQPPAQQNPELAAPAWRVRDGVRDGGEVVGDGQGDLRWNFRVSWDRGVGYPHIQYFDQGADLYEVTRSITRKYELLYPVSYFRRGQREWLSWNVSAAVSSRMFRLVRGFHWNVARDIALYRGFYSDAQFQLFANSDGALGGTMAVQPHMFEFFHRVMTMPEPGAYIRADGNSPDEDIRETPETRQANIPIYDADDSSSEASPFSVGIVSGRFVGDDFNNNLGGSWDYNAYANREGASMEKAFAAIMLTDTRPTFSSVTRGLYLDGREFQVNFFTDMPEAFDRLIGGLLSEDWATVAPTAPPAARPGDEINPVLPQLYQPTPSRPSANRVMFPNFGYRQSVPLIIYSMLFSSLNSELNTINKIRIWTEGGAEQIDVPEAERARFYNPETGVIYVARRYGADTGLSAMAGGGRTIDRGIGSRMIEHANALVRDAFQTDGSNDDGTPRLVRNMAGQPQPRWPSPQRQARALTAFRNYVGVIDAARLVGSVLGYGRI